MSRQKRAVGDPISVGYNAVIFMNHILDPVVGLCVRKYFINLLQGFMVTVFCLRVV